MIKGLLIQCPTTKEEVLVKDNGYGNKFRYYTVYRFEDWQDDYCSVDKCPSCGKEHTFSV